MRIGIVGAGPRGLLTLERLVAWSKQEKTTLTIDLFDLNGIGGVVWQPNQLRANYEYCQRHDLPI
ncbi:hypothetical protein JCM14202_3775 [Agrilactobacillus composti DSM 18527 = JCM 14202]|uniref:FAD/NAD(P)-binding protein n=1 Tax=Agrilactobacillus composti TaxID=398555 RepID=UPI00042DEC6F|nr:FAD/NAD(P)-binding protein [Agrilactobacillus composti]GAF41815.1 hypothetical protein JCM14202_3775 [Agrilactobacillus composti DSM 18527 = JCM 14202]